MWTGKDQQPYTKFVFMSTKCLITFLLRHQLSYYASVSERVSLTSPIIRLQASDADVGENGKVRFDLTGEGSLDFRIDSQTGELIWIHFWAYSFYLCDFLGELFAVKELDRESTSHYKFISTASDGGGNTCVSQVWRLCIRMSASRISYTFCYFLINLLV